MNRNYTSIIKFFTIHLRLTRIIGSFVAGETIYDLFVDGSSSICRLTGDMCVSNAFLVFQRLFICTSLWIRAQARDAFTESQHPAHQIWSLELYLCD